jgi:hypothetical protein
MRQSRRRSAQSVFGWAGADGEGEIPIQPERSARGRPAAPSTPRQVRLTGGQPTIGGNAMHRTPRWCLVVQRCAPKPSCRAMMAGHRGATFFPRLPENPARPAKSHGSFYLRL